MTLIQNLKEFRSVWGSFSKRFLFRRVAQAPLWVERAICCWLLAVGFLTIRAQQPVVNADHSVTFTLRAPEAKKVVLVMSQKKYKMEKYQ